MSNAERRIAHRHQVELPIKYRSLPVHAGGKRELVQPLRHSKTKDVSPEGLLFLSEEAYSVDTMLQLTIPTQAKQFVIHARVIHVTKDEESNQFRTGVQFLNPESIFKVKMAEQLLQIHEYQKKLSGVEGRAVSEEEAAKRWISEHSAQFAAFYN